MSPDQLQASRLRWASGYFQHTPSGGEVAQQLIVQWNALDNDVRSDPNLVAACANALMVAGANNEAESVLSKALKQNWNDDLVTLYGRVRGEPADRQAATAEGWLKSRPNDATLLLALGRISLAGHNWAKAREYLEASLKQGRSADVYGELGRLCLAMGERSRATELLAQALEMSGQLPALPLPEAPASDASAARS
jgi:HemY protein